MHLVGPTPPGEERQDSSLHQCSSLAVSGVNRMRIRGGYLLLRPFFGHSCLAQQRPVLTPTSALCSHVPQAPMVKQRMKQQLISPLDKYWSDYACRLPIWFGQSGLDLEFSNYFTLG